VTALHVASIVPTVVPAPFYTGIVTGELAPTTAHDLLVTELQRLVDSEAPPGVTVKSEVVEGLTVQDEILVHADLINADLVVLGTHGRSGLPRLLLGSTAERVLRKCRRPVMTVPPGTPEAMPTGPVPFTRILCAIDFSESSEVALAYALSLSQQSHGALTLVHAIDVLPLYYDFSPPVTVDVDTWSAEARKRMRAMVPDDLRTSCSVGDVVRRGKPYREILELAAEVHADLIVLGVQGRSAADLFFLGSTTHHVLREAHCAVLTLRA
jgi:nucleotide-binding universal stress UspA family protein